MGGVVAVIRIVHADYLVTCCISLWNIAVEFRSNYRWNPSRLDGWLSKMYCKYVDASAKHLFEIPHERFRDTS